MSTYDFKQELWEYIVTNVHPHNKSNDSQLAIRCPLCGDSRKSDLSTHFYIKINMKADEPVLFNCFLCSNSGILNSQILRSMDLTDLNIMSGLKKYNNTATKTMNKLLGIKTNDLHFDIPKPDIYDPSNIMKKEYFEDRFKIKTTFEEMVGLKCIFKLGQFVRENEIESLTVGKEKALMLHNDYLGFLTMKNEFINFRQVAPGKGRRYEVYSVYKTLENMRKFYAIPTQVDLLSNRKITINIAEGIFTILGVYYHVKKQKTDNEIYVAACGSGYTSVLKFFISLGVFGNVDINIYSDQDKPSHYYKKLKHELKPWVQDINLFYNEKANDFGEPNYNIRTIQKRI